MVTPKLELIHLLAAAEAKATQLQKENTQLMRAFDDLLKAQHSEAMQLAEVTEQLWAAQDALAAIAADKDQALAALTSLCGRLETIQRQVLETQDAARKGVTGLEIQARLFEIRAAAEDDRLSEMMKNYNSKIAKT